MTTKTPKSLEEIKDKIKAKFCKDFELPDVWEAGTIILGAGDVYDYISSLIDEVARETIEAVRLKKLPSGGLVRVHLPKNKGTELWEEKELRIFNQAVSDQQEKINSYLKK